jgi:hypothetical protein
MLAVLAHSHYYLSAISEDASMPPRFVVIPAIPKEMGAIRQGARFYCNTAPTGFDIYDNDEKRRLKKDYPSRGEAETECLQLNQ